MRANSRGESWSKRDTTKPSKCCRGKANSYLEALTSVIPNTVSVYIIRPPYHWADHQCNPAFLKPLPSVKVVGAQLKTTLKSKEK